MEKGTHITGDMMRTCVTKDRHYMTRQSEPIWILNRVCESSGNTSKQLSCGKLTVAVARHQPTERMDRAIGVDLVKIIARKAVCAQATAWTKLVVRFALGVARCRTLCTRGTSKPGICGRAELAHQRLAARGRVKSWSAEGWVILASEVVACLPDLPARSLNRCTHVPKNRIVGVWVDGAKSWVARAYCLHIWAIGTGRIRRASCERALR
jgi:hypothetical protein